MALSPSTKASAWAASCSATSMSRACRRLSSSSTRSPRSSLLIASPGARSAHAPQNRRSRSDWVAGWGAAQSHIGAEPRSQQFGCTLARDSGSMSAPHRHCMAVKSIASCIAYAAHGVTEPSCRCTVSSHRAFRARSVSRTARTATFRHCTRRDTTRRDATHIRVQIAVDAIISSKNPHHFLGVTKQGLAAIIGTHTMHARMLACVHAETRV